MGNIKVLDCTLRDGGRIIDCAFGKHRISNLLNDLQQSGIDIIECGFLRNNTSYQKGSTFFTDFSQLSEYLASPSSDIVIFVDYGMYDMESIPPRTEENPVAGIRFGFTKGNYGRALEGMMDIQAKGYKLFVQAVDTLSYSDAELLELIDAVNQLNPYAFAIVDTYGAMYKEDVLKYHALVHSNLRESICIDFHSHNNYQLSFSLAQEMVHLAQERPGRTMIIDGSLYGMGKVAGNLNTELIADYLNQACGYAYDISLLFATIDENIMGLYHRNRWGYSSNALLSGKYRAHPNNVIYLTEKFKLDTNDINAILSMIDEKSRKRYDYDKIEQCYIEYSSSKQEDTKARARLNGELSGRKCLLIAPGRSIRDAEALLKDFIDQEHPVVISVNFEYDKVACDYVFFAHPRRYKKYRKASRAKEILTSNVRQNSNDSQECYLVDYRRLIKRGWKNFDNAMIMLLRLLGDMDVQGVAIAGFDGFRREIPNYTCDGMEYEQPIANYDSMNAEVQSMYLSVKKEFDRKGIPIVFLTDSIYMRASLKARFSLT